MQMLNAKTAFNRLRLQVHKSLRYDIEADYKLLWLEKNNYKTHYWLQWLKLHEIKNIGRKMYSPETEEIGNWMIRERTVETTEKQVCLNPRAFCWATGKGLFLKPATVVHTLITGPGDPLKETFYFSPGDYTLWLLQHSG